MKRLVATLGLAIIAAVSSLGATVAQDASPVASPVASPEASVGIPPIKWVSNDFLATVGGGEYWVMFRPEGQFSFRADCNGGFGSYELNGSSVELGPLGTTLMMCPEGGQGDEFIQALNSVSIWSIDQSGSSDVLVLTTEDGTNLTFDASLTGVTWQWKETLYSNDTVTTPTNPENYYLIFQGDGSLLGVIDCNHAFGSYKTDGSQIVMMIATTRMFCGEDSQDTAFSLNLAQVTSYVIRDGQLALALPMDAGIVVFDPIVE